MCAANIIASVPKGFIPKQHWPEFHFSETLPRFLKPHAITRGTVSGVCWRFWPFWFEEYTGDTEPQVVKGDRTARGYLHIIKWQRISRTDVPPRWRLFATRPDTSVGFVELIPGKAYAGEWSESTRRDRREWLGLESAGAYRIEAVPWEEFKRVYPKSVVGKRIGRLIIDTVDNIIRAGGGRHISCFGVREKATGETLLAGMVTIHSPTYASSYYLAGFFMPETKHLPLMVGLFDHWFATSEQNAVRFLNLGNFWLPGNPSAWKRFADFKAKFGAKVIVYPPMLYQIIL